MFAIHGDVDMGTTRLKDDMPTAVVNIVNCLILAHLI